MIDCSILEQSMAPATPPPLPEKEFLVIQEISRKPTRTQRDLSQSLGLSLGMTNLLIQRLSRKGLIKVRQLDWKRTQYLLTLKGAVEKTRKAYGYMLYTLRIFRQIEDNIAVMLRGQHADGARVFHLVAQDELHELVREKAAELGLEGASFSFYRLHAEVPREVPVVLTATLEPPPSGDARKFVSLVDFDNISFRL